ncbi:Tellurium resistance [Tsukamurella sp. 8F]|nr:MULTISPECIES: Tellurium resistance [unclassified Tsukamurella]MDF0532129.1 Tellurium resistance [Tsukamurella sp. 8J]MDF0585170.1 Tellurium resistance [Tsukamurella sp. 8F]
MPAATPPPPPVHTSPPVSLSKITLTKDRPTVSLDKRASGGGLMRVNLNWTQGRRGMFGGGSAVDLDLACLYQLRGGDKGIVQALGNSFGDVRRPPYVALDGDDRSGSVSGGENLHINLDHLDEIARILIFAYIYQGAPNWAAADGVVTLYPPAGPEIEVRLDSPDRKARSCAIAMLTNDRGRLTVDREVRYIQGTQSEVDAAYGWGLRWKAGRK